MLHGTGEIPRFVDGKRGTDACRGGRIARSRAPRDVGEFMRVASVTVRQVRIPLRKPIRHASHVRSDTDNLVVRVTLADNTVGHGEGVPREYVTGETIDSALDLLKRSDLGSQLGDVADYPAAIAAIERVKLADIPDDERRCRGNGARCAVELALLDAY